MRSLARAVVACVTAAGILCGRAAVAADDVVVLRGPLAEGDGVAITGVAHAIGAASIRVAIVRRDWGSPNGWSSSWCHGARNEIVVPDGGRFRFEGLVPGTFDLGAFAEGFADRKIDGVSAFSATTDVELRLVRAASVRVSVRLGFEGDVAQTWVSVTDDEIIHGSGRPKDGVLEVGGITPGTYWVAAEHTGGEDRFFAKNRREVAKRVELKSGTNEVAITVPDSADVRFVARSARPEERVEGVLRATEAPPWQVRAPFRVGWERGDPSKRHQGMSSMGMGLMWDPPTESVRVRGLSNGTWKFSVDALGFVPWQRSVTLRDRATLDIELAPLPGRYVELPPLPGGSREIALYADVRPAGDGDWRPLTADDHRFDPTHTGQWLSTRAFLAPGRYVVSVHTPDGAPSRQELTVTEDRSTVTLWDTPATPGRRLRGTTKTRGGAPASGFLVYALVSEGGRWHALLGKTQVVRDGAFEFRGLPPGRCRMAFDAAGEFVIGEVEIADADATCALVVPGPAR